MFLLRDRQVELGILEHGMCVIHRLLVAFAQLQAWGVWDSWGMS